MQRMIQQEKRGRILTLWVCWRKYPFSYTSCDTCFCNLSFSSIRSLFIAVSLLFTAWRRDASFLCFSRHLKNITSITKEFKDKIMERQQIQNFKNHNVQQGASSRGTKVKGEKPFHFFSCIQAKYVKLTCQANTKRYKKIENLFSWL